MTWVDIFSVLGGLGMFLIGMQMMSDGLEAAAGNRMRSILEKTTSNRFLGVGVGAGITSVIQSSSATTVMLVGFVNAGLMSLRQAIGVIMGANIGTTVTAQIIAFKMDDVAPALVFVGMLMTLFIKNRKVKNIGSILLGLGVLFFGLSLMGAPLSALSQLSGFQTIISYFSNPLLAVLVGMLSTAIIQSSSAMTGVIIAMYIAPGSPMTFHAAVFLTLGSNIGTCITALLAAINASRESKRVALAHVLFNVIGTVFFGMLLALFPGIIHWIETTFHNGSGREIAMLHTFFNFATVGLLIWFVPQLTSLVRWMVPEKSEETAGARRLLYLDKNIVHTPQAAERAAHKEVCRMADLTLANLRLALESFDEKNLDKATEVLENEDVINFLNHNITAWLVRVRGLALPERDLERLGMMFHVVTDLERVGDHAENIAEYAMLKGEEKAIISPDALLELREMATASLETLEVAIQAYTNYDESLLPRIGPMEQLTDDLAKQCVDNHITRLMSATCDPRGGIIFTDMVADLERVADHATNIAYAIVGETVWDPSSKQLRKVKTGDVVG